MAGMKKVVVKLELHCDRQKRKAFKAVSALCGIDQILLDMKDDKMTVVGTVDPVEVVRKLRKAFCTVDIVSVGPAKKEENESTKEVKTKDVKTNESTLVPVYQLPSYRAHCYPPPHHPHPCYSVIRTEEDPIGCVIC